jgi:hypothetical protein
VETSDCRPVALVDAASGRPVTGVEDLAVDPASGLVLLSAYDRQADPGTPGRAGSAGLYAFDPAAGAQGGRIAVRDLSRDFKRTDPLFPHGIDLLPGTEGRLFVVNRRYESGADPAIPVTVELFDWDGARLAHRQTLADPRLCRANDLVALGPEALLVTGDRGACGGIGLLAEDVLGLSGGHVLHWDGDVLRRAADGIAFANGIAVRGDRTYVAATRGTAIHIYRTADLSDADAGPAEPVGTIALPAGPDNLSWDREGRLLAAAHPDLFALFLFRGRWLGTETAPSRVLRIGVEAGEPLAYAVATEGESLSGATAAVETAGRLLIAGAHGDRMLICTERP